MAVEEEVRLVARGGGYGIWAGMELFHTPVGLGTWERGVQHVSPGEFLPWQPQPLEEKGFWQFTGNFVIQHVTVGKILEMVSDWELLVEAFDAMDASYGYT